MAISEIHALGSCKAVPASRCYSHNRNNRPPSQRSPLTLGSAHALPSLLFMLLAAMLTSCLALPSESTTIVPIVDTDEVTTVIPPQQPVNEANSPSPPTPTVAAVNESLVEIEPIKTAAAEVADEFVHTSFVSLGGEGLEQGIRNAVKNQVELEIEADSSGTEHADNEQKTTSINAENTDAAHSVREPKTLDAEAEAEEGAAAAAEEKDVEPANAVVDSDKLSVEADAKPVEEPVEEVVNNDKSILETEPEVKVEKPTDAAQQVDESEPETANDKLVTVNESVEPEPEAEQKPELESEPETKPELESESEPKPELESEPEPEAKPESEPELEEEEESHSRPLPSVTSDLVAVIFDENRAITEQPITQKNREALEQEHEKVPLVAELPAPTFEVTKHQVTKKQGVEDLLVEEDVKKQEEAVPASESEQDKQVAEQREIENLPKGTTEHSVLLNEIEENIIESDSVDKEEQPVASSNVEKDHVESTEASVSVVAPVEEVVVESNEQVLAASAETSNESLTPTEASSGLEVEAEEAKAEDTKSEVDAESKPELEETIEAVGEEQTPQSSSTAAPAEPEVVKVGEESEVESDESDQQTQQPAVESAEKDSSEESEELSADEPKAKAEDSTATPLVSYPPHNAGQTFDSNLADERSAYLSLASSNRSTLIIALCSGTAVIFIVISLVIFVLSFQRQHGTLDIEMQEQRLGKDNLDEEDAQMKLLDVDLSTPVIIAMGNEETDECL